MLDDLVTALFGRKEYTDSNSLFLKSKQERVLAALQRVEATTILNYFALGSWDCRRGLFLGLVSFQVFLSSLCMTCFVCY
jgi:hypothetical protein